MIYLQDGAALQAINHIDGIVDKLENLIACTEIYYGIVHESLPIIERNIDLTDQETKIIINYFIETAVDDAHLDNDHKNHFLVAQALQQIKSNFKEISKFLLDQNQINNMLKIFLNKDSNSISFDSFIKLIKEIEKTLVDVSEISLNAIIFASRLGTDGRGFGVISDVIHQTSSQLEKEFAAVSQVLDGLEAWHSKFEYNIRTIVGNQEEAIDQYIGQLDQLFKTVVESIQTINTILRNLMDNALLVVSPFQELMVLIQRQDIVRQNIENVIKCLKIVKGKLELLDKIDINMDNKEQVLDLAVFSYRATDLIERLAFNMTNDLEQSVNSILDTTKSMLEALWEVREDGEQLTQFFYNGERESEEDSSAVDATFDKVVFFMRKFTELLVETSSLVEELSKDKDMFYENFEVAKNSMEAVTSRITILNRVRILAKIELARIVNKQTNAFGEQIESVINHVSKTLNDNNTAFDSLRINMEKDLTQFEDVIVGNQIHINQAVVDVKKHMEELGATNTIINQAIFALYKEIDNLYNEVNQVYLRLETNKQMTCNFDDIKELIGELQLKVLAEKDNLFNFYQVEHWTEENTELFELVNLFTSYLEKYTAKEFLADDSFDAGSAEGELTFF